MNDSSEKHPRSHTKVREGFLFFLRVSSCDFVDVLISERELQTELNVARVIALRRHEAKGLITWVEIDPVSEIRAIERVQPFGAELQPLRSEEHTSELQSLRHL